MDKTQIIPAVIIHQNHLKNTRLIDLESNNKSNDSLTYYENQLKKILNYGLGNNHRYLKIFNGGALFSFSVYHQKTLKNNRCLWDIHVWDSSGNITVSQINFPVIDKENDTIPLEILNVLINDCIDYDNNLYKCSGCGVKTKTIGGQYFAGIYCLKCWDDKYRKKEMNENYE